MVGLQSAVTTAPRGPPHKADLVPRLPALLPQTRAGAPSTRAWALSFPKTTPRSQENAPRTRFQKGPNSGTAPAPWLVHQ